MVYLKINVENIEHLSPIFWLTM